MTEARLRERHAEVLAGIERGELTGASRSVRRLVAAADRAGLPHLAARFRLTSAWVELDLGRAAASLAQLDLATPRLSGADFGRARCLRGLHLCAAGRHPEALTELGAALRVLRRHGDRHWLANALVGTGTARGYLLRTKAADGDFAAAAVLFDGLREHGRAAACVHNRGFVAAAAGDLCSALQHFADARQRGLAVRRHPESLIDSAQALMSAGLLGEARAELAQAARLLALDGRGTKLAEATLTVAQCALRAGDPELAASTAGTAIRLLRGQRRTAWLPAARAVELAALLVLDRPVRRVPEVAEVAAACDRGEWRMLAAELRIASDRPDQLALVARGRHCGPAPVRALGWLARARLARDRRGVLAAAAAGLRVVDAQAAGLGAWELQVGAGSSAVRLALLGREAALRGGRARTVLWWADRHRAAVLSRPPILPPADPVLADRLVRLRAAVSLGASARRITMLENEIRRSEWRSRGGMAGRASWRPKDLPAALSESALVSFFIHNGHYCAVSVARGRFGLHTLGPVAAAVRGLRLRSVRAARRSAAELDELLFGPLRRAIGDRPLVLVPTGDLHAVPWAALPSCAGRPVSVAPSVASWLRALGQPNRTGATAWIAGPGLRHADREVGALHAAHGGTLLTSGMSTTDLALTAMDGAGLAHIAAHGRFRADAPLFSCVELADGPLYGYDLGRIPVPPSVIVLSACDSALSDVRCGDELIGLAAAALRCGTRTVLASVLPVPDDAAVPLVLDLHTRLRAGAGPAEALAAAQARAGHLGFVCLGAG